MIIAIEAGAEDLKAEDDFFEIITAFEDLETVRSALEEKGIVVEEAVATRIPQNTVPLSGTDAEKMLKLLDALEDNDDVQNVYANFDIDEKVMESMSQN